MNERINCQDSSLIVKIKMHMLSLMCVAFYLTLFVNCTPVLMTRGLSGCMGIQGCLSTTKALEERADHVSEEKFHKT